MLEHRFRYLQPIVTCFIDFAFDSFDRKAPWRVMECDSVPEKIIRLIKAFYELTSAQICVYGETGRLLQNKNWCPSRLRPFSYNIRLCDRLGNTACRHSRDIQISPEHRIRDLEYANDVVLFVDSYDEMQVMPNNVSETAAKIGLRVNVCKTKVFSFMHEN
ncbi:unnamed protein product [Dracunculus medinensis]|uniref:Reverse transcriptase domain-containing protein n=1 Tax=Dracunculus medinensis TaxID=318479 RepID=A0A0N4U996_DRAME|nr:unnamed protein product [Dracunculus medinensis]